MSIKEKALQLKQDFDDVHEAGKQSVIANSKYIEKQATGKVISLTDVSEVYHKVKVYGDGQEVDVYGKNLLPYPYAHTTRTTKGITFTDNGNGTITANGTATGDAYFSLTETSRGVGFNVKAGEQYVLRGCPDGGSTSTYMVYSNGIGAWDYGNGAISTISTEDKSVNVAIVIFKGVTVSNLIFKPMISLANISDKTYEPFTRQTITATPNGTEIDSICPCMRFFSDSDITVDYYSSFGMQTEYDRFWDIFQGNGTRSIYNYAFSSYGWTDETFKPKYDIKPRQAFGMFTAAKIKDIAAALDRAGVKIDTSAADSLYGSVFRSPYIERVPYFVMPPFEATTYMFNGDTSLHTIDGLHCNEANTFANSFTNCSALTHVIFSGIIASNINLQWSKLLDDESLISISVTLCDLVFSGLGDGWGSRTLTLSAESIARLKELPYPPDDLNPEGTPYAEDGADCYTVIVGRKGWNIA